MTFVNEYIPKDDVDKYNIEEIDNFFRKAHFKPDWTIDRQRDVYLRFIMVGRDEYVGEFDFTLYWKGTLLFARLAATAGGELRGARSTDYKLLCLGSPEARPVLRGVDLPEPLKVHEKEIIHDLKEALIAFKDFGVLSSSTSHVATFQF
jgi:hypothetical protein